MKAKIDQFDLGAYHEEWIDEIKSRMAQRTAAHNMSCQLEARRYHKLILCASNTVGGWALHQIRGVYLPPGNEVLPHVHLATRVVLYMLHDHPSLLGFSGPDEMVDTVEGRAVDIEVSRNHWVTKNLGLPRVTIAVMFNVPPL